MSDGDVSLIRDEDVLRRMWQQTEDFSRKKEIRAHMYRLREERLRNLYSPEPSLDASKGCEFSSTQGHVKSFADQTFQSMKSKEVRDAGSPPKEFTYRGQDLKDLSNAGWNVESENRTTDDGRTQVKTVNANIEGRYDVDGGKGHFTAVDHHKQAVTEYDDGNASLKRNEDYSNTSAREQVVRQTGDGTHFTSTSSSSTSASKFEQISSTQGTVPYQTNENYDLNSQTFFDANKNEETSKKRTKTSNYEQSLRNDYDEGELVTKKIEYPDDNTKVIVETRCLPDGTRVTSTRREFRAPSVQTRRSEHYTEQISSENKATSYSQKRTQSNELSTKIIHDSTDNSIKDIVNSQRIKDDEDFRKNDVIDYADNQSQHSYREVINKSVNSERKHESIKREEDQTIRHEDVIKKTRHDRENYMKKDIYVEDRNILNERQSDEYYIPNIYKKSNINEEIKTGENFQTIKKDNNVEEPSKIPIDETNKRGQPDETTSFENRRQNTEENRTSEMGKEYTHNITRESEVRENSEKKSTHQYQTTYQTDYSHRKISSDLSPTHQAWASTLRSDTPPRSTTRASSPGNKNYKSSTSSLRSSVSPDKTYKKTPSRGGSPNKSDRFSPTRTFSDKTFSSTHSSTYSIQESKKSNKYTDDTEKELPKNNSPTRQLYSPERKPQDDNRKRSSVSPEKQIKSPYIPHTRPSTSPQRKSGIQSGDKDSPIKKVSSRITPSPERQIRSMEKEISPTVEKDEIYSIYEQKDTLNSITKHSEKDVRDETTINIKNKVSELPRDLPSYMRPTESSSPKTNRAPSPTKQAYNDRKSPIKHMPSSSFQLDKVKEEQHRFIKEENKTSENIASDIINSSSEFNKTSPRTFLERNQKECIQPTENIDETTPIINSRKSPLRDVLQTTFDDKVVDSSEKLNQISKSTIKNQAVLSQPLNKNTPKTQIENPNKQPSRESSPVKRSKSPDKRIPKPHKDMPETHSDENVCKNRSPSPNKRTINPSNEFTQSKHTIREEISETQTSMSSIINVPNKENERIDATNTERNKEILKKHTDNNDNLSNEPKALSRGSPRRSVSPTKPTPDTKNKQTLDFIAAERHNEKINKQIVRDKSRNLSTPSTSPTRKLKSEDTAPSTGHSSPTTESGFVYFSIENDKPLITDLDFPKDDSKVSDNDVSQKKIRRTPSPTKIPCRSPSPEKVINKENLPRKSSLKKPSIDNGNLTSLPKPPTTFLISPNDEDKEILKDQPDENSSKPIKTKPPLERRETYEERCRKILGMTDDDSTVDTKTTRTQSIHSISPDVSPSISPCESPVQEDKVLFHQTYEVVDVRDVTDKTPSKNENQEEVIHISTEVDRQQNQIKSIDHSKKSKLTQSKNIEEKPSKHSPKPISLPKVEALNEKPSFHIPENQIQSSLKLVEPQEGVKESYEPQDVRNKFESDSITFITDNKQRPDGAYIKKDSVNSTENYKKEDKNSEFILTEKEQQILDRVQSSLRKLSPDRKDKPIEDVNYRKSNSMLPTPIDKPATEVSKSQDSTTIVNSSTSITEDNITLKKNLIDKSMSKSQIPSKTSSRNTSPIKKPLSPPSLPKNTTEVVKPRSTSPKKAIIPVDKKQGSHIERPQSPQVSKTAISKTKEQYQRTSSSSTVKKDKSNSNKTITKTQSTTRVSPTKTHTPKTVSDNNNKTQDNESKRIPPSKVTHSSIFKKEIDSKVTRTASDIGMKSPVKKNSPQRMKSKPEIQLNNVTTNKIFKPNTATVTKQHKPSSKEMPTKLPVSKPKSATALNISIDSGDEIIIDVQQAKSSRENSPDRICPTPVGFSEDIGTPRFPDEVNEPDDEINKRSHNIIHEAESIVDDIVEICEDDELFVKRTETEEQANKITEKSRINDRETRYSSITEKQIYLDHISENLKSDECLLSVSEKVNKFAKGPIKTKDKSPSRNIKEEYDRDTVYTDDYTKLSVNDKAHLFIETAENVKTTKQKSVHKPERPDLSNVDDSLKSDECLLSVSDKVNKFVKTAEQILSDTYSIDEKDKKIKEEHEKIMKQIVDDVDDDTPELEKVPSPSKNYKPLPVGETHNISHHKQRPLSNKIQPVVKQADKPTPVKITTLRSSEAVKKAKALFENIASETKKETSVHKKSTKLTDIGVSQKATKPRTDAKKTIQDQQTIQKTDYDVEQNKQNSSFKQELSETNQMEENLSINRSASPTQRGKSPVKRPVSPVIQEKIPIDRTLSPSSREKSPLSKSPITRDKSPIPRNKSPNLREDLPTGITRSRSPHTVNIAPKKVVTRYPLAEQIDSSSRLENKQEKSHDKVPGYQRPTKTSQMKEDKHVEEIEVSSRRGSGKFGVELRRTSSDRSSVSSERRRSSVEHHQPCIEDIYDIDLLEQMLEKVVGYEQRRRIRAQIRVAKKKMETEETTKLTKTMRQSTIKVTKTKSPERLAHRSPERSPMSKKPHSPDRKPKPNKTTSPDRQHKPSPYKSTSPQRHTQSDSSPPQINDKNESQLSPLINGHLKEDNETFKSKAPIRQSPDKQNIQSTTKTTRPSSPEKRRPVSPSKPISPKTKSNRFSEYASAYMKKVGLKESDKINKYHESNFKKVSTADEVKTNKIETSVVAETHHVKTIIDRTSSKDVIEVEVNRKKSLSPDRSRNLSDSFDSTQQPRKQSPERKSTVEISTEVHSSSTRKPSPTRQNPVRQPSANRSPSPDIKKLSKKETITKTKLDNEKKIPQKQEEKPSWVTSRNLKKVTSETRTFSSKKIETEKPKYRATSPSKVITKPIDVITSSYGPGPLDAEGRPLFGIKALRNGATNYQVKGTVIRQEFHSRNGGDPEGTVSVTAYSTEPEDLEKLLQTQGERPSRLHGLAAITTTKKFGGETGSTFSEVATKEERAALDQFTHSDRRVTDSLIETHSDSFQGRQEREKIERVSIKNTKKQDHARSSHSVQSSAKKETRKDTDQRETRNEKMQKTERRMEDRKTVRQSSVKSLTEKFINNASESAKSERIVYPKAGLILRTAGIKDSTSSESSAHAGLVRTDSEHSLASLDDMMTTTTTTTEQVGDVIRTTTTTRKSGGKTQERSFLDSSTKVTGVQDILTRMKNADIVIEEGDSNEDSEARALLNKFLGATVLMAGMQNYVTEGAAAGKERAKNGVQSELDIEQCWDERILRKLLDECTDYEQRRRLRARIRALMAEQEACASAVTDALAAAGETVESIETEEHQQTGEREEEVTTITSSVRRNSSEQTVSSTTVKNSKVIESMSRPASKPVSPFAKFRQLEKQNSTSSPNSPKTPQSPGSPSQPYFKFTDPALQLSAVTIKERLLQWCRDKTRDYENVKLENFSTSWADGLAFCALLHHFLPDAFDYSQLTPDKRRHNFTLAFKIADEKAGIYPLLDVDDMVAMRKPDWKCVFTYVQSIYRRFKDEL